MRGDDGAEYAAWGGAVPTCWSRASGGSASSLGRVGSRSGSSGRPRWPLAARRTHCSRRGPRRSPGPECRVAARARPLPARHNSARHRPCLSAGPAPAPAPQCPPARRLPPVSEIGAPSREAAVWGRRRRGRGSATVRLRREPAARSRPGAPWALGPLRRSARRSTLLPRPHSVGPRTWGEALTLPGVLWGPHRARGPNELACLAPSMHGVRQRPRVGSVAAGSAG